MSPAQHAVGDTVTVRHDIGSERGIIVGMTMPSGFLGDVRKYTVQFADGTISSWPAWVVTK